MTNRLRLENSSDLGHFAYLTNNFVIQEPETYEKAMASNQAEEWADAIKQKIDSLVDHGTWDLIPKADIQPRHKPLKGKWAYKIKRGVDNQITRFKTR